MEENMKIWESGNKDKIHGWVIDYEIKPGFKVITFTMIDKSEISFEVKINNI